MTYLSWFSFFYLLGVFIRKGCLNISTSNVFQCSHYAAIGTAWSHASTDTFLFVHLQRLGLEWTKPALLDSVLSLGVILHGLYYTSADINISLIKVPQLYGHPVADAGFSFIYLVAGLYCYWAGLALAPYRAFYALAMIGLLTAGIRIRDHQARSRGDIGGVKRRHHRHWSKRGMWNLSVWSSKNSIEGYDCHISELPAAGMFQINAVRETLQMEEHLSGGWFFWVGALADGTFFHKERGVVKNWIPDFWTFWEAHGRGEEHKSVPNQKILLCWHGMLRSTVAWCDVEIENLKCKASAPKMSKFKCTFDVSGLDRCTRSYAHLSSWVLRNQ